MSSHQQAILTTHIQAKERLKTLFQVGLSSGHALAIWRLPGQQHKHLIVDLSKDTTYVPSPLEELPPGFIFTSFDNNKKIFIHSDLYYNTNAKEVVINPVLKTNKVQPLENFIEQYKKPVNMGGGWRVTEKDIASNTNGKEQFLRLVAKGVEYISEGVFEKVVPSRIKSIPLPAGFDPVNTFEQLCEAYPHAFVSLVSVPGTGTWIGATPELLVSIENQRYFKTVALAGTQKRTEEIRLSDVAWKQKEIEEQALVGRYVINCFKKIRLREYYEYGPKTVTAGNLFHLKTEYTVDMEATNFPLLGSVMLDLLHPTSAICGMPLDPARGFILENEGIDRSFFSGYLGPVNFSQSSYIYVNLRCMQLLQKQAVLYAGAGVTIDSDPEREWAETEMKMNTLLNVIQP